MIKILSYKEHPKGKKILNRYLYSMVKILPFAPEDILGTEQIEVDGVKIAAADFINEASGGRSIKKPRRRTKEYEEALNLYVDSYSKRPDLHYEQDYLLAARRIEEVSKELYEFLYQKEEKSEEDKPPKVKRENLRKLLTTKMDELERELPYIPPIEEKESKMLLKEVFRYDVFSNSMDAVMLLKDMDVNVCPYCNRLYTVTLSGKSGKSRPQFDHYKSKIKYPYLAVSLMNLIPSCGLCNQAKSDGEERVLYPYSDEMGEDVVFRTRCSGGVSYLLGNGSAADEFDLTLELKNEGLSAELKEKIQNSDKIFHLTELYNEHKDYVLYLFWHNYIFNDEYLETLCEEFPEMFHSVKDVKSMLYLMDIDKKQWGRRPLSKLTHDMDEEMHSLKGD